MGINGLLPLLKSIQKPTHIKNWKGQTVAVDAYGWLHRGTISCAIDLALGKPTTKYVDYAMHRVRMLKHYGVIPYIVFDGDYLPNKKGTELERERKRLSSKKAGLELLKLGNTSQAQLELQKAIDVTPLMARYFIDELKKAGVSYIVAPYEADAQMAYLEHTGEVSAIISEDSDLLVFGAKCLITKLDQYGDCISIDRADFPKVSSISLTGWTDLEFRRMAILSGCDYLANIPKLGIKSAYKYVRKYKTAEKIIRAIRMDGSYSVPSGYERAFFGAEMTFEYQRVYCPTQKRLLSCNGSLVVPNNIDSELSNSFGRIYDSQMASKVAYGDLDPISKLELVTSASVSSSEKSRIPSKVNASITTFFARRPLKDLQTNVSKAPLGFQKSVEPISVSALNPTTNFSKKSTLADQPLKKRRLCMDDEETIAACTERSPFFIKSKTPMKPIPSKAISGLLSRQMNENIVTTAKLLGRGNQNPIINHSKHASSVKTCSPVGGCGDMGLKISLEGYRLEAHDSQTAGSKRSYPFASPENKENTW